MEMILCAYSNCSSSFSCQSELNLHLKNVHKKDGRYVCAKPTCEVVFDQPSYLKRHKKQRSKCEQCQKTFASSSNCLRHKRVAHGKCEKTSEIILCLYPDCSSSFSCQSGLNLHLRDVHKKDGRYMCTKPTCNVVFDHPSHLKRHEISVHEKQRNYKCEQCQKTFASSSNCMRHKRVVHGKCEKTSEIIMCLYPNCSSSFSYQSELNSHLRDVHKKNARYVCTKPTCHAIFDRPSHLKRHEISVHEKQRNYKCDQCGKTFASSSSYNRHKRSVHGVWQERSCNIIEIHKPTFICAECGVKYNRKDSLVQHITTQHGNHNYVSCTFSYSTPEFEEYFRAHISMLQECHHCGFKVKEKRKLQRHILSRHFSKKDCMSVKNGPFKCVLCEISYKYLNQLNEHYADDHDIELNAETLSFSSMEEFSSWRHKLEDSTITRFRLWGKFRNTYNYICHRSGFFNSRSTGKRELCHRGSKKLNGFCSASIKLKLNKDDSSYTATFIPTHVGHAQNDTKELKFIFFRKEERENLAKRIAAGVPLRRILDDEVLLHQSPNDTTRRTLHSKDLYNLQASFNIKASGNFVGLRKNDSKNVEEFVYEYKHSILLYKRQGESGPEEFSDCKLNDNDMILVFMSPSQKNLLKKYGNEVVCLDGTSGLNPYGFILHILLVLDYDGEAIPIAFLFSNRNDKMAIKVFLRCIREKTCEITSPHTLMTDMQESYYNAWVEEMGKPQLYLYCVWHVWRAWETHLPQRNEQLKQDLCDLTVETCPKTFQEKLEKILSPRSDNEVNAFLKYFKEQYCDNNKWMHWSYAYRMHYGINTSMHLEGFYDIMKYFFSRGKTVKDLYSGLKIIVRYVRRKTYDLNMKLIYGNIPSRLSALRKAHKEVETKGNIFIQKIDEEWLVPSFKGPKDGCEELYTVCKSQDNCPAEEDKEIGTCPLICRKCDMCVHKYICSCEENSIRSHMCKHIHAVVLFERKFQDSIELPPTHNRNVSCSSSITESVELGENNRPFSHNDDNEENLDRNTQSFSSDDSNDKTQESEWRKRLEKRMTELMRDIETEEQYELMNSWLDAYQRSSCLKKEFKSMMPEQCSPNSAPLSSLRQPTNIQRNPHHFILIPVPPEQLDSNNFTMSNQPNPYQQGMPPNTVPYRNHLSPNATLSSQQVSQNSHPQMRLLVPSQDLSPMEMYSIVETSCDM